MWVRSALAMRSAAAVACALFLFLCDDCAAMCTVHCAQCTLLFYHLRIVLYWKIPPLLYVNESIHTPNIVCYSTLVWGSIYLVMALHAAAENFLNIWPAVLAVLITREEVNAKVQNNRLSTVLSNGREPGLHFKVQEPAFCLFSKPQSKPHSKTSIPNLNAPAMPISRLTFPGYIVSDGGTL